MALVLLRLQGERICIRDRQSGTVIWVGVEFDNYFDEPRIKVSIDAPAHVHILRGELVAKESNAEHT